MFTFPMPPGSFIGSTSQSDEPVKTEQVGGVPMCPNHGEPLYGLSTPPKAKGTGWCPVSNCGFDYQIDIESGKKHIKQDKFGNITQEYDITLVGEEN